MEHAQTKTSLPARRRHIRKISVFPLINGLLFTIICLLILVPLWKVLVDSLDLTTGYGMKLLPDRFGWDGYETVLTNPSLVTPLINSVITTVSGTFLGLLLSTLGAYVLIQFDMPGRGLFAGLLLFSIIPFIQNILYSFRKMGTFGEGTFIGLKNYQDLLKDDTFWLALQNTVFYAVVGVPLVIIFSIFLAHQINKKIRGRTIYRTLLFIPAITIPAAIGILWRWILNYQYGIFNWILEKLGFSRISWLGDVKYVRWAIILVVVWSMVSYYVIIMLAAMQGIDSSYYEAARLDGASSRQVFFKITLPMLTPMIFFSVIMVTIGILQIFDFIYLMVDRQTLSYTYSMSLVTYFYECAFNKSSMRGYGAAISVVLAAIIMVITMIQMVGKKYWVRSGE